MPFSHEALASWPTPGTGDPDRELIRAMTTRRFAYCLATDEAASDFTAKDPDTGVPPLYLIQNGTLFAYDETDGTTAGDGVTCLVTDDDCRYKSETIAPPWSVLDKDLTAQPVSPSDGDRYLIPTAATGTDWAGKDGKIGIFKGTRWHFAVVPIGRFLYVEDETAFYHRNTSGVWTAGVGSVAISPNSVDLTKVLGANASFVIKVENQTTNAPPASPVVPTAYIIGPSPTGAWAGNTGKLAICRVAGSFTIITPAEGDTVYDKALKNSYRFNGTAWESSAGAWIGYSSVFTQAAGGSLTGSGTYTLSVTTAPTQSQQRWIDPVTLTYTAKRAGAKLRISYRAGTTNNGAGFYAGALFMDSVSNAIAWDKKNMSGSDVVEDFQFVITATDALPHTYKFAIMSSGGSASSVSHRLFQIEEAA